MQAQSPLRREKSGGVFFSETNDYTFILNGSCSAGCDVQFVSAVRMHKFDGKILLRRILFY
eukprot:m.164091 g.164091  ORF g.164091 m.164091 type:complete len:61 (-) comp13420_c0_seq6:4038-4220(-)